MRLSERKRGVLYAVVNDFIAYAEPVGSRQVSKRKGIDLSSATIRSVMAELEELGFLTRSHASSGRIPTTAAYRFYVDELMHLRPLSKTDRDQIRNQVESGSVEMHEILRHACRLISSRVNRPSVGLFPRQAERNLKQIQFIRLRGKLALAVLVSFSGIVENKILELDRPLSQNKLDRMHNYLNERLAGLSISEIRKQLLLEMKRVQYDYDQVLNQALLLGEKAFSDSFPDLHIEGQSHLASDPEFANVKTMQQILRTLEEKTALVSLLDQSLHSPGVKIFVGEEVQCRDVNGLTLITSAYSDPDGNQGLLGVIGPTRLDYARIVPLVEFTSKVVTEAIKERAE